MAQTDTNQPLFWTKGSGGGRLASRATNLLPRVRRGVAWVIGPFRAESGGGLRPWAFWPYVADVGGLTLDAMPSRRYRMSSSERAETLLRTIDCDDAFRASRRLGYAYIRVVDVEHPTDACPDRIVHAIDPLARLECVYPDIPDPTV